MAAAVKVRPLASLADSDVEVGRHFSLKQVRKRRTWFGYLPLRSEFFPLDAQTGRADIAGLLANVGAGLLIGMRETMGGIVSASLIFSTAENADLLAMFPFGIGMMWYSTGLGIVWYALFGRLQYAYGTAQDVVGILQANIIAHAATQLADHRERIPATALCIIYLSSVLTGVSSLIIGKLGLGKYMLLFPAPVTSSFLGSIGFVILRTSLQTSSGVKFHYFYPENLHQFLQTNNAAQVGCQLAMVCFMRLGPKLLQRLFPDSRTVKKLSGIICQLLPLAIFYTCTALAGIDMERLTASGWTYPRQGSGSILDHWTTYRLSDADFGTVLHTLSDMPALVLMAVLCTTTGALSITDRFPTGPDGDPNPDEAIDFDVELTTVGASSTLLGLTGGTLTFHTFTAIQLRLDGGTHRVAVLSVATFVLGAFASGAPIGHFVPKWFLSGLFMNTAFHFLRDALLSYRSLPYVQWGRCRLPSPQYGITLFGMLVSVFFSPTTAIGAGMVLSIALFLVQSGQTSPVVNVVVGNQVVSRMKRPYWEIRTLRKEGDRILLLYLQGHLFFGSVRRLVALLSAAATSERARYCILSFARVERVDPSAARHLKALADKGQHGGFRIICCRMNAGVFSSLVAVGMVTKPNSDLVQCLQGLRWKSSNTPHGIAAGRSCLETMKPTSQEAEPDAFAHETDALDYCERQIITDFCYSARRDPAEAPLERHMMEYRRAVTEGARLSEWAFEEMNGLQAGTMARLREHCEVREEVTKWTELPNVDGVLCFILRGAVSLVQVFKQADEVESVEKTRGFSFRQGKRLVKRYTPGHVVGKTTFFLRSRGQVVDPQLTPLAIVSSAFGPTSEVWVLRERNWHEMPSDLQAQLTLMLCVQFADDDQHSKLQEH